jgi:NTP pyrophosphatase (non-canonical NTP hydrolase)
MKLNEYQKIALERLNPSIKEPNEDSMRYCCMGIIEEAGEVVAEIRKPLYKGNFHEKPLDREAIKGELGDIVWYIALICKNNSIDINKIDSDIENDNEDYNKEKLIKRVIKIGRQSGIISKRYIQYNKKEIEKEKLEKSLKKQYKNVLKLASTLDISIDDILVSNIKKANSRYTEEGKANIKSETDDREEK